MKRWQWLTMLAIVSGLLHLRAEYWGPPLHIYVFKPLTMLMIIAIALEAQTTARPRYRFAVVLGLVFSLGGDVLLMLPVDAFVFGLVSFLIGHLVYIYAFQIVHRPRFVWARAGLLGVYGAGMFAVLFSGLGDLTFPVAAYIIVILTMVYSAWGQWSQAQSRWAKLALLGAVLFVISDTVLALNKFGEPFVLARALTLGTYFPAQWLIARSTYGEI